MIEVLELFAALCMFAVVKGIFKIAIIIALARGGKPARYQSPYNDRSGWKPPETGG